MEAPPDNTLPVIHVPGVSDGRSAVPCFAAAKKIQKINRSGGKDSRGLVVTAYSTCLMQIGNKGIKRHVLHDDIEHLIWQQGQGGVIHILFKFKEGVNQPELLVTLPEESATNNQPSSALTIVSIIQFLSKHRGNDVKVINEAEKDIKTLVNRQGDKRDVITTIRESTRRREQQQSVIRNQPSGRVVQTPLSPPNTRISTSPTQNTTVASEQVKSPPLNYSPPLQPTSNALSNQSGGVIKRNSYQSTAATHNNIILSNHSSLSCFDFRATAGGGAFSKPLPAQNKYNNNIVEREIERDAVRIIPIPVQTPRHVSETYVDNGVEKYPSSLSNDNNNRILRAENLLSNAAALRQSVMSQSGSVSRGGRVLEIHRMSPPAPESAAYQYVEGFNVLVSPRTY